MPKLEVFTAEENEAIAKDLSDVLEKHGAQLAVAPEITSKGTLGATLNVFKKQVEQVETKTTDSPTTENSESSSAESA